MVGLSRLERLTSPLSAECSNQLSYRPRIFFSIQVQDFVEYFAHQYKKTNFYLPRKEVIQPQVLLQLPCYDFTPIASHTIVVRLHKWLAKTPSGTKNSHGVTGGVYKVRERIHRVVLIRDYQRFQLHEVELQTSIRTQISFMRLAHLYRIATLCTNHCNTCVALDIRTMMT